MLAYVNGDFVQDEDASISVRDRGFMLGDGVFEVWRTYGGRTCDAMIKKNLERLTRSLRYIELEPEPLIDTITQVTTTLIERNAEEIRDSGDVLLWAIVTRGSVDELAGGELIPTVVSFVNPIPARAVYGDDLYGRGARLVTSLMYRDPWGAVDPRVKSLSRLAYVRAERKMSRAGSRSWTLFCDSEGNPTEASGANLFIADRGQIVCPPRERVLGGINMTTFTELAAKLGIPTEERSLTLYDYLNAEEVILTTTSVGAVRVTELDEIELKPRGDVYDRVMPAWFELVGCDFVSQSRERAGVLDSPEAVS
jgi:branched-chain amino acid aminotransferase